PGKLPLNTPWSSRTSGCVRLDVWTSSVRAFGAHTVTSTVPSPCGTAPNRASTTDSVRLHAAGVCSGLQEAAGLTADRGHAAERPRFRNLDLVPALPE